MLDSKTVAKAGELLLIDKGEYSDYCVMGLFRSCYGMRLRC